MSELLRQHQSDARPAGSFSSGCVASVPLAGPPSPPLPTTSTRKEASDRVRAPTSPAARPRRRVVALERRCTRRLFCAHDAPRTTPSPQPLLPRRRGWAVTAVGGRARVPRPRHARMLTIQEAADRVRLTQWAIYRAIQRGELTAYKPGGRLRIHEADLEAWLESTRVQAKARSTPRRAPSTAPGVIGAAARPRASADSLRARVRTSRGKRRAA